MGNTYELGLGMVCTDPVTIQKSKDGTIPPLAEIDGRYYYTRQGKPALMPDRFEEDEIMIALPKGTVGVTCEDTEKEV